MQHYDEEQDQKDPNQSRTDPNYSCLTSHS